MSQRTVQLGPREVDALARMAWAEARGERPVGQMATVAVALNRAATGRRDLGGSDVIGVLNHPGAFTPVTRAGGVDRLEQPPQEFTAAVAEFVASFSPETDPTAGATFFNSDGSNPYPSHLTIGGHTFHRGYRERVEVPSFQAAVAEPVFRTLGIEAPTRTARAPATGPILTDETSLLTPYADGGTARLSQMAGIMPPARPTDLEAAQVLSAPMRNTDRITSGFGMREHPVRGGQRMHPGVDISRQPGEVGAAVYAMEPGVIETVTGPGSNLGRVVVAHADGSRTSYLHVAPDVAVQPGMEVRAGQMLATVAPSDRFSTGPHLDVRKQDARGNWVNIEPQVREAFARQNAQVAQARPPSPTQAVAARARNPANMTAFVEPPEPAPAPTRVASAPATTMTDAAQNAPPLAERTLQGYSRATTGQSIPTRQGAPSSPPAAPSRSAALGYAPDVMRGMSREPDGVPRESGRFGLGGPTGPERAGVNLSTLAPSILGGFESFGALTNTPQAQARTGSPSAATRDVTRIGASAPMVDMSPLTPPSVARPAQPPADFPTVSMPAPRVVRTVSVGAVPGTIPGARPPSAPAPAPAPPPAQRQAPMSAPMPPERPAFIPNNPNAPYPVRAFESGVAGIGNFVERNTRGLRSSLNDRYGDYYGGDMFAYTPQSYGGQDALSFANMDAAMRGPGAPGLFDLYERDFGGMSRGGSTAGAIIGGMFGGPIGGLVGGLTGGTAGEAMGFGRREARDGAGNIIDPQSGNVFSRIGDFLGNVFDGGGQGSESSAAAASGAPRGNPGSLGGMGGMQSDPFGNDMSTLYN
jgi:murein DD-endopeptidase MepM/ murein hydrolase activator NlpD